MPATEESPTKKPTGEQWLSSSEDGFTSSSHSPFETGSQSPIAEEANSSYPLFESQIHLELPWWRDQDSFVISGVSCQLPESDNMQEFEDNLFNKVDMVTEDARRWEPGLYGLPRRHGKLKDYSKFDAQFFGVPPKQAHLMDPQVRKLLQVSYEAILDSGTNPLKLRGTKTGVFVGQSGSESIARLTQDPDKVSGYSMNGCASSMFANRLSYCFDFRGPSFAVDTACNSSLLAFQLALTSLREGQCTAALVCGANATLTPTNALQFTRLGVTSPDGACRSFDANGLGYAKSEGIGALLLQRSSEAHRVYCTVIHAKSNTDGYKEVGITFPSGDRQAELLRDVYHEAGVDPTDLAYLEAHGTGTKVGDPQETGAVTQVLLQGREEPLLVGSVKSNMGHAEPASGVASLAKVIIAMNTGIIPPNLHFNEPNPNIPALLDGRLKVVTEPTPWNGGFVGINSFGFGGANTHVLLKSQSVATSEDEAEIGSLPRLINFCGRTEDGLKVFLEGAERHKSNPHFLRLLHEQSVSPMNLFPYRGYILTHRIDGQDSIREMQKVQTAADRPVWFVYSGMGAQWVGMGRDLMVIDCFRKSVLDSSEVLRHLGTDPYSMLMQSDKDAFKNVANSIICNTAVQLALTDVLRAMGITPDGIVGHSTGEIACGYADGGLTRREAMLLAYHRGTTVFNASFPPGAMAAVGMTWEEAKERLPEGVVPACHNGYDSVSISGDLEKVEAFVGELKAEGVFAKMVDSSGIAFHSPCMKNIAETLTEKFTEIITQPKQRTERWVSSSCAPHQRNTLGATCSAEYHVNNVTSPVLFYEALQFVPENAITIEIAPHALLQAILRRTLPATCTNVGLMKARHENSVEHLLQAFGKLYCAGLHPDISVLYPRVEFPVPLGTPLLSSFMRWDHSQSFTVVDGSDNSSGGIGSTITIDPFDADNTEHKYLLDHVIDGRSLYPFTGYPVMAWKALCKVENLDPKTTGVIFEDLNVYRPTILSAAVKFHLILSPGTGEFQVLEGDSMAASGKLTLVKEGTDSRFFYDRIDSPPEESNDEFKLKTSDVYKEFLIRGYEYRTEFRGIEEFNLDGTHGKLKWNGNWVTFLDSMLQSSIIAQKAEALRLPVRLRYLRLDPVRQLASVQELEDGSMVIPVTNHGETNGISAGGVEMRDLNAQAASRRTHHLELYVERTDFVENEDQNCLEAFERWGKEMRSYKEMCLDALKTLVDNWGLPGMKLLPNGMFLEDGFKDGVQIPERTSSEYVKPPKHALYTILQHLSKMDTSAPGFATDVKEYVQANAEALSEDKYWASTSIVRCVKPALDIIVENSATHNKRCAAIEPTTKAFTQTVKWFMQSHPQVETDWTLAGPTMEEPEEDDEANTLKIDVENGDELPDDTKPFDLLIADRLLSRKIDPERYLVNLKKLVRDDGFVLLNETTNNYNLALLMDSLLYGSEDLGGDGSRKFGRYFSHEQILKLVETTGYRLIGFQTDPSIMGTIYLIKKIAEAQKDPAFINIDDIEEFTWIEKLQKTIEERLHEPDSKTIWLTGSNIRDNGIVGLNNCFREEYVSQNRFRSIQDISLKTRNGLPTLDLESAEFEKILAQDIHQNCYRDGKWGSFRGSVMKEENSYEYGLVEHAHITNLVTADLSSLTWVESPNSFFKPNAEQEICYVYYSSLNFRDIMLATGRLSADAIPGNFSERDCVLGTEYSGRLANGKRVMGTMFAQALATTVVAEKSKHCWDVPQEWTLEEAATVPVVYLTAYHSLMTRGNMKRGEKVLIHSGSGGVGQAAIAIALAHGCEVFTTVGSEEKKQFLKNRFPQLQDRHFSNSRTMEFESDILSRTNGKGVDIVLNSLAEDKLQASLRCLGNYGRFLEIGKVDMAKNSKIGMELLLKNITIHGVVLDGMETTEMWRELSDMLLDGIRKGVVKPIPPTCFTSDKVEDAFRFMASGKHIGKVVIRIREEESDLTALPKPITVRAVRKSYCNPDRTYLITGGLGGFGIELAQWLTTRGAKKLVLTSRSGVTNGYQARNIKIWRRNGVSVKVSKLDISNESQAKQLVEECEADGKLGGVFHLAMVLRDSLFENQKIQNFQESAQTKYWGTKYLDQATRQLCGSELEWFVAFSSIASGRGNNGQTAYGWANSTMERMMEQRAADGLAGLAIQWGAVGDVGVVLQNLGDNSTVVGGTLPQRIPSCLQVLDTFLSWKTPIACSFVRAETGKKKRGGSGKDIAEAIARILGVNDVAQIDPDTNLVDLGLDSLMGMEIKQAVERESGVVLSMKEIQSMTLNKLKKLGNSSAGDKPRVAPKMTSEELKKQMFQQFRLRLDANDLLSDEHIVPLNEVKEGKPLFLVHSMEGVAGPLLTLGSSLPVPAYCFQSVPGAPMETLESLSKHYIEVMKTIQPEGPYRIAGYSYGAGLAFEMAATLQRENPTDPSIVESLILLDGSHTYMKAYRNMYRVIYGIADADLVNNPLFESEIIIALAMRFADFDLAEMKDLLLVEKDWESRLEVATGTVMKGGLFEKPDTFKWICTAVRNRFLAGDKYVPTTKFRGLVNLIRAQKGTAKEEDLGKDYGLSEVTDGSVKVQFADGDHEGFVQGDNAKKTVEILMKMIN